MFVVLAELALEYLKVLAWPAVVLLLVLVYKRPIIGVLARLRKATAPGVALELFSDELADAAEEVAATEVKTPEQQVPPTAAESNPAPIDAGTDTSVSVRVEPQVARWQVFHGQDPQTPSITRYLSMQARLRQKRSNLISTNRAWARLQAAADQVGDELGLPEEKRDLSNVTLELVRRNHLRIDYVSLLTGLQALRREIGEADEPPTDDVVANFNSTAAIITEQFDRAHRVLKLTRERNTLTATDQPDDDSPS